MAYRKSYRARRRVGRKNFKRKFSRKATRQMIKPKFGGVIKQPVHYFTRYQDGGTIMSTISSTVTYGNIYFELAAIPNYSEFGNMYEFYKINAVQVRFIPLSNVTVPNTTVTHNLYNYRIITVCDYNDRAVPTSLNDLRQYSNCKVGANSRVHKRFLHPKPLVTMDEDSGSGTIYGLGQLQKTPWISTASNQCEWYGIKYGIETMSSATSFPLYKVEYKFYLSFKGVN